MMKFLCILNNQPCLTPFVAAVFPFKGHLSRGDPWQDHHWALQACTVAPSWRLESGDGGLADPDNLTIKNGPSPQSLGLRTAKLRAQDRPAWRLLVTIASSMISKLLNGDGDGDDDDDDNDDDDPCDIRFTE